MKRFPNGQPRIVSHIFSKCKGISSNRRYAFGFMHSCHNNGIITII